MLLMSELVYYNDFDRATERVSIQAMKGAKRGPMQGEEGSSYLMVCIPPFLELIATL